MSEPFLNLAFSTQFWVFSHGHWEQTFQTMDFCGAFPTHEMAIYAVHIVNRAQIQAKFSETYYGLPMLAITRRVDYSPEIHGELP